MPSNASVESMVTLNAPVSRAYQQAKQEALQQYKVLHTQQQQAQQSYLQQQQQQMQVSVIFCVVFAG